MFLRVLVWVLLLVGGWFLLRKPDRRASREAARPPAGPARRAAAAPPARSVAEPMVDCAHCGLHLPSSEALRDEAVRAFCSAEHRRAGPR